VSLQKAVDLVAGLKAKQAPQIRFVEMAKPILFRRQGLQSTAGEIVVPGFVEPFGNVVGNVDRSSISLRYLAERMPAKAAQSAIHIIIISIQRCAFFVAVLTRFISVRRKQAKALAPPRICYLSVSPLKCTFPS
jgi:hypothetical protein